MKLHDYLKILEALNNNKIRYISAFNGDLRIDKETCNIEDLKRELKHKLNIKN